MRIWLCLTVLVITACQSLPSTNLLQNKKLSKFSGKSEFDRYLKQIENIHKYRKSQRFQEECGDEPDCEVSARKITVLGSRLIASDVSITNNQVQGVDEGDIIKTFKDYLIILRKGKLHTVKISDGGLAKVHEVDAHTPNWKHDVWIDEILINHNTIIVLGYNYEFKASEFIRFSISDSGVISYRDTHFMKSNDYFDSENYASRLYKNHYTSYLPIQLYRSNHWSNDGDINSSLPKVAKAPDGFRGEYSTLKWKGLISYKDIYKPIQANINPTLHTFIKCPLDREALSCDSVGIIGGSNSEFYVAGDEIYFWNSAWSGRYLYDHQFYANDTLLEVGSEYLRDAQVLYDSKIYKIEMNELYVDAVSINGQPVNQFSFHKQDDDLYLYLENLSGSNLVKIPDSYFSSLGHRFALNVSSLPDIKDPVNNRFVTDYLILGSQSYYEDKGNDKVKIVSLSNGSVATEHLGHTSDRIDKFGEDVLIAGVTPDNNFGISSLSLENKDISSKLILKDRLEGEYRSHAYNFSEISGGVIAGLTSQDKSLGEESEEGYYYWNESHASDISFINSQDNTLSLVGTFKSQSEENQQNCDTSCIDWYGNTRPFFIGERVFGLSGDELIEGKLRNGKLVEIDRINYTQ